MNDTRNSESLSFYDAFFLYLEQPGVPLNVAAICEFEGEMRDEECVRYIESRLPLIPRFLDHIEPPALGLGAPRWQRDPHFNIRNHVRAVTLARGSSAEWRKTVSQLLSPNFDRSRPLWDLTLAHNLAGRRTGVVLRAHHCVVDGVAGVSLLRSLLDDSPDYRRPRVSRRNRFPAAASSSGAGLIENLLDGCLQAAQTMLTVQSELLRLAERTSSSTQAAALANGDNAGGAVASAAETIGRFAGVIGELAQPVEKLPFNTVCRGPMRFDWLRLPLDDLLRIKRAAGSTVNEAVLAIVAGALRRYAELHSLSPRGRSVRIVVPVNARAEGEAAGTGNRITFLPVDVPLGVAGSARLLDVVREKVAFSRTGHATELVTLAALLAGAIPTPLQMLGAAVLRQLPISLCNTICTNVRGPEQPLYMMGRKLLVAYPYVPIGGEMGMNCAVLSYNGAVHIGFTGDAHAIPDLPRLAACFRHSFESLCDACAQPKPTRTDKSRARTRRASRLSSPPAEEVAARAKQSPLRQSFTAETAAEAGDEAAIAKDAAAAVS